jgi:two-component system cell cycle response regulator
MEQGRPLRSDTRIPKRGSKRKRGSAAAPSATPAVAAAPVPIETAVEPTAAAEVAPPEPAVPAPFLMLVRGKAMARELRLDRPTITIGRGEEADARLLEEGVSRLHARVTRDGDDIWVEDLGSTNKTSVNGQEISGRRQLAEGDEVGLGKAVLFRFVRRVDVADEIGMALLDRARRDPLTGTLLRAYFDQRLRAEFSYAQRHRASLALALIEIDRPDPIEDELLAHLGARLRREAGEHLVARHAASTFAILARADLDEARALAERLRRAVEAAPFPVGTSAVRTIARIGLAAYPLPEVDRPDLLVAVAARALAEAKARGPGRVVVAELSGKIPPG